MLILGGAGFTGINAARYFLARGWSVTIFDNFSRAGTTHNVKWLKRDLPRGAKIIRADIIKNIPILESEVGKHDAILHLAAQVAVMTSIADPVHDFTTNVIGTFNVLEAVRRSKNKPTLIYSSTNKVYGCLPHRPVVEHPQRFKFKHNDLHRFGISEAEQLDFHSPYGCSKGAADKYVKDYARIYGLNTVVFRQSCIYGPYQFGIEDQGWVAWLTIAAHLGRKITLYGNGKQVRDVLYIDDLLALYEAAISNIAVARGKAYNVGGGPENTVSLLELLSRIQEKLGRVIPLSYAPIRAGDQPVFVADIRKATRELGWKPKWSFARGYDALYEWIEAHKEIFKKVLG